MSKTFLLYVVKGPSFSYSIAGGGTHAPCYRKFIAAIFTCIPTLSPYLLIAHLPVAVTIFIISNSSMTLQTYTWVHDTCRHTQTRNNYLFTTQISDPSAFVWFEPVVRSTESESLTYCAVKFVRPSIYLLLRTLVETTSLLYGFSCRFSSKQKLYVVIGNTTCLMSNVRNYW